MIRKAQIAKQKKADKRPSLHVLLVSAPRCRIAVFSHIHHARALYPRLLYHRREWLFMT